MIQEPYATKRLDKFELTHTPEGFTAFHNLNAQHPYGSEILVKNSIKAHMDKSSSNEIVVVNIVSNKPKRLLICAYCRPSSISLSSSIKRYLKTFEPELKRDVICMDSNAKSPVWNSQFTDKKGKELENLVAHFRLKVANAKAASLKFVPAGTAFVDFTLLGGDIIMTSWKFLHDNSLSDHPYIFFELSQPFYPPTSNKTNTPPRVEDIDADLFIKNLAVELEACDTFIDIDSVTNAITFSIISSAKKSKIKKRIECSRPLAPWWTNELGALRKETRKTYKQWSRSHRSEDMVRFKNAKVMFQRCIRKEKSASFKKFIDEMNGDANCAFKEIKKSTNELLSTKPELEIKVNGRLTAVPATIQTCFGKKFSPQKRILICVIRKRKQL
jgi:hypothetical protein